MTAKLDKEELMAVAAFRYYCGRETYAVGVCADWLIENWPNFLESTRSIIKQDLERAFLLDNSSRGRGGARKPLGSASDRADWERVRALWK